MSEGVNIAEAIVADLNANVADVSGVAVYKWRPEFKLDEKDSLHVTVTVEGIKDSEIGSRGTNRRDYRIDVIVQKRFSDADIESGSTDMFGLCESIADRCLARRYAGIAGVVAAPVEGMREQLRMAGQFTALIMLTARRLGKAST